MSREELLTSTRHLLPESIRALPVKSRELGLALFVGVAASIAGFLTGLGMGSALLATALLAAATGRFPHSLPGILLVGPGLLHAVSFLFAGATNRGDVLADPLKFMPILIALFIAPIIGRIIQKKPIFPVSTAGSKNPAISFFFGAFVLWMYLVVRYFGTPAPTYGLTKIFGFLAFSLLPSFLFILLIHSGDEVRSAFQFVVLLGTLWLSLILFLSFSSGNLDLYNTGQGEALGGASQTGGGIGGRAALVLILAVGFLSARRHFLPLNIMAALVSTAAIFLSGHRTSIASGVVGLFFLFLIHRKHGSRSASMVIRMGGIALVALGVMAALQFAPQRIVDRYEAPLGSESFRARISVQKIALLAWEESPIVGHGTGASSVVIMQRDQPTFGEVRGWHPHNVTIELLAEVGIVGAGIFLFVLLSNMWRGLAALQKGGADRPVIALALSLCVLVFVASQGGADLTTHTELWLLGTLLAISLRSSDELRDPIASSKTKTSHS